MRMKIVWPSALRGTDHFQYPLETIYQTSRGTKLSQSYSLRILILSEYCLFQHLLLHILNNCISLLCHGSSPRTTVIPCFFPSITTQSLSKLHYFSSYRYVHLFDMSWHNNHLQNKKNQGICYCMIHWLTDALSTPTSYKVLCQICQIMLDFLAFFLFQRQDIAETLNSS